MADNINNDATLDDAMNPEMDDHQETVDNSELISNDESTEDSASPERVEESEATDAEPMTEVAMGQQVYQDSDNEAEWYVIHTYSGYENKVKTTLEQVVENRGLHDYIQEIEIPVEEIVEIKDGKKKTSLRKIYPGYVLINMVLTDEIWYIVRNTRGVTGFVGPNSRPIALTDEELAMMGIETDWEPIIDYGAGDSIKIINGPLEGFIGAVEEVNMEKKRVRVSVSMFGRETPVELEFTQVLRL